MSDGAHMRPGEFEGRDGKVHQIGSILIDWERIDDMGAAIEVAPGHRDFPAALAALVALNALAEGAEWVEFDTPDCFQYRMNKKDPTKVQRRYGDAEPFSYVALAEWERILVRAALRAHGIKTEGVDGE